MKITTKQLQEAIEEAMQEGLADIDRAEGAYKALVKEALETKTDHLQKKWPDLADKSLRHFLANIIASHLFNHAKQLPGQFNPKKKWTGHYEED